MTGVDIALTLLMLMLWPWRRIFAACEEYLRRRSKDRERLAIALRRREGGK